MSLPPVTTGMLVVFGLIAVALLLFVTEALPPDITAIGVLVSLVVLGQFTKVPYKDAIAGFASPATVTIMAMYILSEGVQRTGVVERLGFYLARITKGSESRLLGATVGTTGVTAGLINNTPVVAVFIPMITKLADDAGISPSKLLLPLSYAAMLGGTLTLVGTSTNILASDLTRQLLPRGPIGMFEFTPLGIVVLLVGIVYLMTVGRRLVPERLPPRAEPEAFDMEDHLLRLVVREESPLVGQRGDEAAESLSASTTDAHLVQLEREAEPFLAPGTDRVVQADDVLVVRATRQAANELADEYDLRLLPREEVTGDDLAAGGDVVTAVVPPNSSFVNRPLAEAKLQERFDTTVLAVHRNEEVIREGLDDLVVEPGDTFLLQTSESTVEFLAEEDDLFPVDGPTATPDVDESPEEVAPLSPKTPVAVGTLLGVIALAAVDLLPIVIAALGGVVVMIATGCLTAHDAYDAVSWNVIFLLAGVLPLGVAMRATGGAEFIAAALASAANVLPAIAVLGLFYLLTGVLANIITPVASVVLMIPVAVDTASRIGAEGFAFVLAVMFAASAAFATPIGYQTNLMVYGPGGYKFTDYVRVGAPLQLLLTVVVTGGIAVLWGV